MEEKTNTLLKITIALLVLSIILSIVNLFI